MANTQTQYFVVQHDQGCSDEVDSWLTVKEAKARIREIEADIEAHPSWYRHLACPSWSIERREVTLPDFLGIVEI